VEGIATGSLLLFVVTASGREKWFVVFGILTSWAFDCELGKFVGAKVFKRIYIDCEKGPVVQLVS
jgi:hypothetical protein